MARDPVFRMFMGMDIGTRAVMSADAMRDFIATAERFEFTEPDSEYVIIGYRKGDQMLVYDMAKKPHSP